MSVLIFVENWEGKFKKLSFELVSYGAKLAEMLSTEAIALTVGEVEDSEMAKLGKIWGSENINAVNKDIRVFDSRNFTSMIAGFAGRKMQRSLCFPTITQGNPLLPGYQ